MNQGYLLRLPPRLKELIAADAGRIGISINALIIQILWAYIEGGANNDARN